MTQQRPSEEEREREGEVLSNYLQRLVWHAERNMSSTLKKKIGTDDIANSVMRTILRRKRENTLPIDIHQSEQFWRYLAVVSKRKIYKKWRDLNRKMRSIDLEVSLESAAFGVADFRDASDVEGKRVGKLLDQLYEELDDDHRLVLEGRINGLSNLEIAKQLDGGEGMSTKAVTRKWNHVKERLLALSSDLA